MMMVDGCNLSIGGGVDRMDSRDLSYSEFVERYLRSNKPVILTGLVQNWPVAGDWAVVSGSAQRPNLSFFASNFQNSIVQVADCNNKEYMDQKRLEMSFSEYINYWLHINDTKSEEDSRSNACTKRLLYLKDWHFVKEYPDYAAYSTPPFFLDDWLNLYLDSHHLHRDSDIKQDQNVANCADYRFVYMGPKGTWTPLHADVFRSYSWSVNVCGRKLWYLLPPSQCSLLFDRNLKASVYDVRDVSDKQFPDFKKTVWLECIQEPNEIIFVPSGWYHQVHNLDDTISINHNWFNAYNLSWVWNLLWRDYDEAKGYIEDIRDISDDFESLCQRNLAANTGMNFYDFFIFIARFALAFMVELFHHGTPESALDSLVKDQVVHNLTCIKSVAESMVHHEAFSNENMCSCSAENRDAFSDLVAVLRDANFQKFCLAVRKTYKSIYGSLIAENSETMTVTVVEDLLSETQDMHFLEACGSKITGPGDLIKMIDIVIRKQEHHSL